MMRTRHRRARPERLFAPVASMGMPPSNAIVVSGAREHNLKDVSLELPRDALVVITGLSGSGKSSPRLRHDLRRGPAPLRRVAVAPTRASSSGRWTSRTSTRSRGSRRRSRSTRRRPRATRARRSARSPRSTTTCACSGRGSATRTATTAARRSPASRPSRSSTSVMTLEEGTRFMVLAPVVRGRKGEYGKLLEELRAEGFARVEGRRRAAPPRRGRSSSTRSTSTTSRSSSTAS